MFLVLAANSIQLVPDGTLFFHVLLILLMVLVLNATLFRPINRVLEERERRTRGRSGEAHEVLRRVEAGLDRYDRTLRGARASGYQLLERERNEALRLRQEQLGSLREELSRSVEQEKKLIADQVEQSRAALEGETRQIAEDISRRILDRPLAKA
jgi:F-type H+-transporting ATPase subunit b